MKTYSKIIPPIINQSLNKNWLNVFLFNSSIQSVIGRMIIDRFKIKNENILLVSSRNTDLSLFNHQSIKIYPGKYERYLDKLFFYSTTGGKILKVIKKSKKNFLLFTPMADKETNWLLSKQNCEGHVYIENGQHSWMNQLPYSYMNTSYIERFKLNWRNRMIDGYRYRNDASAFIGIHYDSFPDINSEKKFILNNLNNLKKYYTQKLKGINTIGLTCASRRLKDGELKLMLNKLIQKTPPGSVIKPHPSFTSNNRIYNEFKKSFNEVNKGKLTLCKDNVILELEMLYEKKQIIGPQTSLSKYSVFLGSSFKSIQLY